MDAREMFRRKALDLLGKEVGFYYFAKEPKKGLCIGYDRIDYTPIVLIDYGTCPITEWDRTDLEETDYIHSEYKELITDDKSLVYLPFDCII